MLTGHLETAPFVWPVCRSNGSPASGSVCEPFLRAQGTTDCVSSPVLGSVFKLFSVFRSNFGDFNHPVECFVDGSFRARNQTKVATRVG